MVKEDLKGASIDKDRVAGWWIY